MRLGHESSPLKLPEFEAFEWNKWIHMRFNPRVSAWAAAVIWAFIIASMAKEKESYEEFTDWSQWIGTEWAWLYIGSQDIWVVVLVYLLVTKYGNVKLGKDDEEPEFTRFQWFSMLFAAGVGVGLFYYGLAEPVWHYSSSSTRWADMNDNDRAQHAIMVTIFHWGIHGWIAYTTIGALLALVSFRRDYPMTIRSCFIPLLGDDVLRGALGDMIDILSICATLFGVCTSLGLGVMQLNDAVVRLDKGTYHGTSTREEGRLDITKSTRTQIAIIWVVTLCATISVVTGVKGGILTLSLIVFTAGCFILGAVLFMGDTILILNSITSVTGYYLWYLPKISFHTDAWETADDELAPDGKGGSSTWLTSWTIFYWGWWIAFAPFVGSFIAKISRGRTLGEFVAWTMIIPTAYCILWFGILGSEGIRLDRRAEKAGLTCDNPFGELKSTRLKKYGWEAKNQLAYDVRLSCLSTDGILFDALAAYGTRTYAYFSTALTSICLLFYFVTSSDSGSLVIDSLAANGDEEPPMLQRIFWAFTEGAAATALLSAGQDRALRALQSVSIVSGLPYTFILCYLCYGLILITREELGELDINRPRLRSSLFKLGEYIGKDGAVAGLFTFVLYAACPFIPMGKASKLIRQMNSKDHVAHGTDWATISLTIIFYTTVAFLAASPALANLRKLAGCLYMFWTLGLAMQRLKMRETVGTPRGDIFTDYLAATLAYPLVLSQNVTELELGPIAGAAPVDEKKVVDVDESKEAAEPPVVDAVVKEEA